MNRSLLSHAAKLLLFSARIPAGFPGPAEEHAEDRMSLSSYLYGHPDTTFFVQLEGDMLVVDRLLHVRSGDIVLANVNSEYTVKKLEISEAGDIRT